MRLFIRLPDRGRSVVALVALAAVLAGCASTGDPGQRSAFKAPQDLGALEQATANWPKGDWWLAYGNADLNRLMAQALEHAPSVLIVQARLEQAQAQAQLAGAALRPRADLSASTTRERLSENYLYPPTLGGHLVNDNVGRLSGSWTLDLFGRDRAALEAAVGASRAAEADREAVRWSLSTQIARDFFNLARLVELRDVARATLHQREQTRELVSERVRIGLDTQVELRQADAAVPQARQELESLNEQIALGRSRLAVLAGVPLGTLDDLAPHLPTRSVGDLPAALPAELIGRRPDVVGARWRAESTLRGVDEARAAFYPNVNLSAFIGLHSLGLDQWIKSGSREFGVAPAVSLPVLDGGRLRANLRGSNAAANAAIETYNQVLLMALRDVADAVTSTRSVALQTAQQHQAQEAAEAAYGLALTRYQAGLGTYLTVLSAESAVLNERRQAAELKARTVQLQVALVRALGGGYQQP